MTAVDTTPPSRRINVAVTPAMLAAIDKVIEADDGVTLTEAVRRLIGYGEALHDAWADGDTVIRRGADGKERVVARLVANPDGGEQGG